MKYSRRLASNTNPSSKTNLSTLKEDPLQRLYEVRLAISVMAIILQSFHSHRELNDRLYTIFLWSSESDAENRDPTRESLSLGEMD